MSLPEVSVKGRLWCLCADRKQHVCSDSYIQKHVVPVLQQVALPAEAKSGVIVEDKQAYTLTLYGDLCNAHHVACSMPMHMSQSPHLQHKAVISNSLHTSVDRPEVC